jgi:TRAP-type C4-dicarboxylate transport system substrate-binding protein
VKSQRLPAWCRFSALTFALALAACTPSAGQPSATPPGSASPSTGASPSADGSTAAPSSEAGLLGPGPNFTIEMIGQPVPTNLGYTKVERPYADDIWIPASNGRMTLNLTTRDERGLTGAEFGSLLSNRQVDIAYTSPAQVAGEFPLGEGLDLAGVSKDGVTARAVALAFLPAINEQLQEQGFDFEFLTFNPSVAQEIYCREPISSLAEMEGRRTRIFGSTLADFVRSVGAQPVDIPFAETYSALERGVLDCAITGSATGNTSKWFEVASHVMAVRLTWATQGYAVHTEWWNGLEPDVRDFLRFHLEEASTRLAGIADELTLDGEACNGGDAGGCKLGTLTTGDQVMTVVQPTAEDEAFLADAIEKTIIPAYVERCGTSCGDLFNEYIAPIAGVSWTQ